MRELTLDGTDLRVPRLSFGTASLHHCVTSRQRQVLLSHAFDCGFTHFDASPYYGYGLAETELGRLPVSLRNRLTVSSKVGLYPPLETSSWPVVMGIKAGGRIRPAWKRSAWNGSLERADRSLAATLRRLNRTHLDILFLHEPLWAETPPEPWLAWLEKKRSAGQIRFWGVAGEPVRLRDFLERESPLAQILQCRDSRTGEGAGSSLLNARFPHLVYGVLGGIPPDERKAAVERALDQHPRASILVSSRRLDHVSELAGWVAER